MKRTKQMTILFVLFSFLLIPAVSMAGEYKIQTLATQSNAGVGEGGAEVAASALITVVVTFNGLPATQLGETVGDGTSEVTLPAGWTLTDHTVPPGGCMLSPTEFYNWEDGSYSIRVVPFLGTEGCTWLAGDYHYVVKLEKGRRPVGLRGSGLGSLTIK